MESSSPTCSSASSIACRVIMACALADSASASAANSVDSALASRARIVDSTLSRFGPGSGSLARWRGRRAGWGAGWRGGRRLGSPGRRRRQRRGASGGQLAAAGRAVGSRWPRPSAPARWPSRADRRPASRRAWTRRRCRPSGLARPPPRAAPATPAARGRPRSDRRICSTATSAASGAAHLSIRAATCIRSRGCQPRSHWRPTPLSRRALATSSSRASTSCGQAAQLALDQPGEAARAGLGRRPERQPVEVEAGFAGRDHAHGRDPPSVGSAGEPCSTASPRRRHRTAAAGRR